MCSACGTGALGRDDARESVFFQGPRHRHTLVATGQFGQFGQFGEFVEEVERAFCVCMLHHTVFDGKV